MKKIAVKPAFQPVALMLESQLEYDVLVAILNQAMDYEMVNHIVCEELPAYNLSRADFYAHKTELYSCLTGDVSDDNDDEEW